MPDQPTLNVGELRKALADQKLGWQVAEHLDDAAVVPRHPLGGTNEGLVPAAKAKAVNFKTIFKVLPTNPLLAERAIAHNFRKAPPPPKSPHIPPLITPQPPAEMNARAGGTPPVVASPPSALDWRSRWGWSWITTVRDQGHCEACWAFAAVALTEAMLRIEHCVFPHYSEGDVHKGMGTVCANTGGSDGRPRLDPRPRALRPAVLRVDGGEHRVHAELGPQRAHGPRRAREDRRRQHRRPEGVARHDRPARHVVRRLGRLPGLRLERRRLPQGQPPVEPPRGRPLHARGRLRRREGRVARQELVGPELGDEAATRGSATARPGSTTTPRSACAG